eukprot:TRINITY_DN8551_c1_g1_i1.p1 TRINITY_DN8551_c1_g1~~TRINITY_DN8551_c1_g1_i1.p1  ORF type:complete len:282 (+),score=40.38 TRINITY_DN8551_c1_g1_i1:455-1300(+)
MSKLSPAPTTPPRSMCSTSETSRRRISKQTAEAGSTGFLTPRVGTRRPPPGCGEMGVVARRGEGDDLCVAGVCLKYEMAVDSRLMDAPGSYLLCAIDGSNMGDLKLLVEAKVADIDAHYHGQRPIHHAIRKCRQVGDTGYLMTELLLQHGSSACKKDGDKEAPLLEAASMLSPAVHALLRHGANASERNALGETAQSLIRRCLSSLGWSADGAPPSHAGVLSREFAEGHLTAGVRMREHVRHVQEEQKRLLRAAVCAVFSRKLPGVVQELAVSFLVANDDQ